MLLFYNVLHRQNIIPHAFYYILCLYHGSIRLFC